MSVCAIQTFTGITESRFAALVQAASKSKIVINGNVGQTTQDGFTVRWSFDPTAQTLDLQCMAQPFFATCGMINGKIHDLVDGTAPELATAATV